MPLPFQLLEINVISAQDLAPVTKSMKTYVVAWVHLECKVTTRVDQLGHTSPSWNDKFVFRVDDDFLNADNSAIMIEIYACAWLRDVRAGTVRILINNLISAPSKSQDNSTIRFVALQVRRPSGRPQGILNMGVALLDNTMRSMPLYTELSSSTLGYNDLMDLKAQKNGDQKGNIKDEEKIYLRCTQSERTESVIEDSYSKDTYSKNAGSVCNGSLVCNGSMLSGSEIGRKGKYGNGSMLNGSEVYSDVGPSPSVVAAEITKGIYPLYMKDMRHHKNDDMSSSILEDWTVTAASEEGLKSKIERW